MSFMVTEEEKHAYARLFSTDLNFKDEYIKKLKALQSIENDTESAHIDADDLLLDLLKDLGYDDVVKEYEKIDKWYA